MSEQEYIKSELSKMRKDMKQYFYRGEEYQEKDMKAVADRLVRASSNKQNPEGQLTPQEQRIRDEMKQQLMIDEDTRRRLLRRKRVPAFVQQAEQEKNNLRSTANANAIVKLFKGISKAEKEQARTKLNRINAQTTVLRSIRAAKRKDIYPDYEGSSVSYINEDLTSKTTIVQRKMDTRPGFYGSNGEDDPELEQAIQESMKTAQRGYYGASDEDADLKRAIQESLKTSNSGNYSGSDEDDPELQRAIQESLKTAQRGYRGDLEEDDPDLKRALLESMGIKEKVSEPVKRRPKAEILASRKIGENQIAVLKRRQKAEGFIVMPKDIYEAAEIRNNLTKTTKVENLAPKARILYDFLDDCVQAYRLIKEADEELYSEAEGVLRGKKQHNVVLDPALRETYEYQGKFNCYCCAGTALYNQFMLNQQELTEDFLKQGEMREYEPDYLTKEEFEELYGDSENYDLEKADIELFAGLDQYGNEKGTYGNIYAIGDFFLKRRKDIAVQRSVFSFSRISRLDKNASVIHRNMIEKFKDTVADVLKTGNALALRVVNHYITITGIDGDRIQVLDSLNDNPKEPEWRNIQTVLGYGNNVELTWLRKIDDPAKLASEFENLEYKDGCFRKLDGSPDEDVAHKLGVNVSRNRDEKDQDVGGYVQESIYVNKVMRVIVPDEELNKQ